MLPPKDIDWLNGYKNKTLNICCLQETHFRPRDAHRLKVRGRKKIFYGASLVAQWLRIRLPMQGTEPWSGKIPHAAEQLGP